MLGIAGPRKRPVPHHPLLLRDPIFHANGLKVMDFRGKISTFHAGLPPERATPVGYAALIDAIGLKVPMPRTLSAVGPRHKSYQQDGWQIYTPRAAGQP